MQELTAAKDDASKLQMALAEKRGGLNVQATRLAAAEAEKKELLTFLELRKKELQASGGNAARALLSVHCSDARRSYSLHMQRDEGHADATRQLLLLNALCFNDPCLTQEKTAAVTSGLERIAALTREKSEAEARARAAELEQARLQRDAHATRSHKETLEAQVRLPAWPLSSTLTSLLLLCSDRFRSHALRACQRQQYTRLI